MKILVVIPYFYPSIGGLQNYALEIAQGLHALGHEIVVITTNHDGKGQRLDLVYGLRVYRLPILFTLSNTPVHYQWFETMERIIRHESPDLINAHTPVPFISDLAAMLAQKYAIPFVLTYQNDLIKSNKLLQLVLQAYYALLGIPTLKKADKIIASSQYYADKSPYLQQVIHNIRIISPGVALDRFAKKNFNRNAFQTLQRKYAGKKIVLFTGQLDKTHRHKGLSYLLEALSLLKDKAQNVHVLVIGKGNDRLYYQEHVKRLQIENQVTFVGFVADEDLAYFHAISVMTVLPSYNASEGFGMVLIEAGASHRPVVASRVGGIPFVVEDGKTGFLVEPRNAKQLAHAMHRVLVDTHLAEKMGKQHYQRVKDHFTWEKQIARTHQLFTSLVL